MSETKKIFDLDKYWQDYILCILIHMIFPLSSILIEWFINDFGKISLQSLTLATSMYAIAIGFSSTNKVTLGLGILISFAFSIIYGITYANMVVLKDNQAIYIFAIISISIMFIVHGIERYNRHIALKKSFWTF